jgi:hypothetical protein
MEYDRDFVRNNIIMMNHMNGGHQIRFCIKPYSIVHCVFSTCCSFDFCGGDDFCSRNIMNLTVGRVFGTQQSVPVLYYYCKILLMYLSR